MGASCDILLGVPEPVKLSWDEVIMAAIGPNDLLRRARESRLSPSGPGRGEEIDTSHLPSGLAGRRAQINVDPASTWTLTSRDDRQALLHLLEAERSSPDVVRFTHAARIGVAALLSRERRPRTPGLRALAERARIAIWR